LGRRGRTTKSVNKAKPAKQPPQPPQQLSVFASIAPGFEAALADELGELGFRAKQVEGGVYVMTTMEGLYVLHCWSRLAGRITVEVGSFRSTTLIHFADQLRKLDLGPFLWPNQDIDVRVACRGSRLRHRETVAKKTKLALQDASRRPRVVQRRGRPTAARVHVRIVNDLVTVAVDASGELLHRRGWRRSTAKAPIRENLGAAVLLLSGWAPGTCLVDPMCGSGTFGIEAALICRGVAPGLQRNFAFEHWPAHDPKLWKRVLNHAEQPIAPEPTRILVADRDSGAVKATNENARRAKVDGDIEVVHSALADLVPPDELGILVVNPPYGERIAVPVGQFYRHIGRVLRERWSGWQIAIIVPDLRYVGSFGFPVKEKARFSNGGITVFVVVGEVPHHAM
jgi:putative N6-adenine-specific DNA methylase